MGKKVSTIKKIDMEYETRVHPGLKVYFGYNLYKIGIIYKSLMEARNSVHYNLGAPDCGILYVLSTGSVFNQLSLGQELGIDKATIVKIIDKLEKLKLVKRETAPDDRRSKLVTLTAKGAAAVARVSATRSEIEKEVFTTFSKEEEAQLRKLVPKLLEVLMNIKQ